MLPNRWRWLFLVEVPICFGTAAYWLMAPEHFLQMTFSARSADAVHAALVVQLAGVLFSILVWTYGRWLLSGRVELRPFRMFQEGLALGDVFLVAEAIGFERRTPALNGQIAMASFWLVVRLFFLWSTRSNTEKQ